jgi:IclR family transcriptional regulator, KDG regulon repressor
MAQQALKTVDRALSILELLAHHSEGLRPVDLARIMALNKVTVHRMLKTLENRGFIDKRENGRYLVGLKLVAVASLRLNNLELKTEAQPWLRQLACRVGQPVHLAIRDQDEIVYIEKVETVHSMRMYSQIGKRGPLHCTALGKVLLAGLPDEEAIDLLKRKELKAYTPATKTDPVSVLEEIRQVRRQGCAFDRAEHEPNVYCIATPVHDYRGQVIAAVSTSGDFRPDLEDPDGPIMTGVLETAEAIEKHMGYHPETVQVTHNPVQAGSKPVAQHARRSAHHPRRQGIDRL